MNADAEYHLAQTAFNRWVAAQQEVASREAVVQGGGGTGQGDPFSNLLDAVRRAADAQREYYQRLVNYNKAIADVHLAKGSLLEYDGVYLAEGPWPQKAYFDALGYARRRDAGTYLDYGVTRPSVVSRGPIPQFMHGAPEGGVIEQDSILYGVPTEASPLEGELVPTPEPSSDSLQQQPMTPPAQPETLPSPSLDGPILLPDFANRPAESGSARPNQSQSIGTASNAKFEWGAVGLEPPQPSRVRQASAEIEVTPEKSTGSALQWAEPGPGAASPISAGNWKSSVR